METWRALIDFSCPVWDDYQGRLLGSSEDSFPGPAELNQWLPAGLAGRGGQRIRFVPASDLPAVDYESHIYRRGEVSTRENSWHDLFNALIWSRFPSLKVAMNAMHFREMDAGGPGCRGERRDALTLFDESGVIVCCSDRALLDALARRDWNHVFRTRADAWKNEISLLVVGHALLEKFLHPYKAITAQALLLQLDGTWMDLSRGDLLPALDEWVAECLLAGALLDSPASLSPVPLMGIPGWWLAGEQSDEFYADRNVFRSLPESGRIAPVYIFNGA